MDNIYIKENIEIEDNNEKIYKPIETTESYEPQFKLDKIIQNDNKDDDVKLLNGDNDIDVGIKPDVKQNDTKIQICSCLLNITFSCFNKK